VRRRLETTDEWDGWDWVEGETKKLTKETNLGSGEAVQLLA